MKAVLFNLMHQRFNSTAVAERISSRIIEEAEHGEQHVRDYLRKNLEFTKSVINEVADILFRSKYRQMAYVTPVVAAKKLGKFDPKAFLSTMDGGGKIAAFPRRYLFRAIRPWK